ncbi:MAG: DUF975 family protein [Firmicutes bacterium]|nr:DUF975 family protein [Bacillota bacterium]
MNRVIVTESTGTIKSLARQMLAGRWKEAIAVFFMFYAVVNIPSIMINMLSSSMFLIRLAGMYGLLIQGPLNMGLAYYFLKLFRRQPAGVESLFMGFGYFFKAFSMYIVMTIKIFLWTLFFVIPGIYAAITYSMSWFILADDPNKGINQCMFESAVMMRGNILKYILLRLSFIGLRILADLPSMISEYLFNPQVKQMAVLSSGPLTAEQYVEYMRSYYMLPISRLLTVLMIFVEIYEMTSQACFYDIAGGELAVSYSEE